MASAIVLCAGFGTRLRPLTDELPKPLAPVGDRSILEHALTRLSRSEAIGEISVNAHHLADRFGPVLAAFAPRVQLVVEPHLLGTAGGVAHARALLAKSAGGPVLVWNGDILIEPPIEALLGEAPLDSFCLAVAPRRVGEGTVGLGAQGQVVRLRGERFGEEQRGGDYVGVLALGAEACAALPETGCLFADAALPLLRRGGTVRSVSAQSAWSDAGDIHSLLAANLAWLDQRALERFVAASAEVAPAVQLERAVVGAGARVVGTGKLERCVVCPGAVARAPLCDALIAPSGRVIPAHV